MEKINNPEEQSPMTEKEMAEMRKKITAQYSEEIVFLKVQAEYEELMAQIEEYKLKRYTAMARTSNLFAQMESEDKENHQAREDFEQAKKDAENNGPREELVKKRTLVKED